MRRHLSHQIRAIITSILPAIIKTMLGKSIKMSSSQSRYPRDEKNSGNYKVQDTAF